MDYHNKYLGTEKIRGVVAEGDISVITLKNNQSHTVPTLLLPRLITDEPNDHGGEFSHQKIAAITKDIFALLHTAYRLTLLEAKSVARSLDTIIDADYKTATIILWGKYEAQVQLSDIAKVLSERGKEMTDIMAKAKDDVETRTLVQSERVIRSKK